jgi:ureidoglycolate lyase
MSIPDRRTHTDLATGERRKLPHRVRISKDREGFKDYGLIIEHNGHLGARVEFTRVFETTQPGNTPRLHVNRVEPSTIPLPIRTLERHPESWQTFLPLDVPRYLVFVAGSQQDGTPDLGCLHAWILDGRTGVAFAPGVWHASATVFDGIGQFAVIWPRRDCDDDTQFHALPHPLLIEE